MTRNPEQAGGLNILLIFPRWPERTLWSHFRYKFPALGPLSIAAATPPEHTVRLVDENIAPVDFAAPADLVGISVMTPLAPRAYALADEFRARGRKVVLGGIHVSSCPDEAAAHADAVVIGEGERVWPQLLADFTRGGLQARYRLPGLLDMREAPPARRDLLPTGHYITRSTIQFARGCPYDCEYCSVTAFFGRQYRFRPYDHFIREYRELPDRFVFIVDDNIVANRAVALGLFDRLRGIGKWWGGQAPINVADDDELLGRMARSGCKMLFIGFESLEQKNLEQMGKQFVKAARHAERIGKIQDHGIAIQGSFIAGYDHDEPGVFDTLREFINRTRMETFLVSVLTPFPGTRLTERLAGEGRILSRDWGRYDMNTVVFQPRHFTPETLQAGCDALHHELYRVSSILRRTIKPRLNMVITVPQNFGFREAWRHMRAARRNS